jgi:HPt (histidine-containing phosphotransfer) domain-containing protein
MIDEIREKFLPRFVAGARDKLERASKLIANGSAAAPAIASDLHTIAGEAAIMGLAEIADQAREAERAVRQVGGLDDPGLLLALYKLYRNLDTLTPSDGA